MSSIIKAFSRSSSETGSLRNPPHEARRQLSWLNDCAKDHRTCNEPGKDAFLPTRLVDTLLATLEAHQREIVFEKLPKTLRDAIEVTKSLSFPFIWIDALCIIQDSRPDWEYELETMVKIYSCAFVTIAAGWADTCQGGFLQPPRSLSHPRIRSILPSKKKRSKDES
ncbi:hypothetical protein DL98DRAFT_658467 [Cadophora sp. DSE1049]|nr:hypothetical protein DL98DRAFT_658467 [Cadophora sp. DSE1049]